MTIQLSPEEDALSKQAFSDDYEIQAAVNDPRYTHSEAYRYIVERRLIATDRLAQGAHQPKMASHRVEWHPEADPRDDLATEHSEQLKSLTIGTNADGAIIAASKQTASQLDQELDAQVAQAEVEGFSVQPGGTLRFTAPSGAVELASVEARAAELAKQQAPEK
jgi:hypothetical protein